MKSLFDLHKPLDPGQPFYSVAPVPKYVISGIRFSRWLNPNSENGTRSWVSPEHFVKINSNMNINVNFSQNEKFKSCFRTGFRIQGIMC